ncbi:MAG: leucyl/phenylalanyl-tRNA--protein transferase [Spirochaetales bacterium]|nr:leucyl/phenylalanyl-tRNA--protein transferase [Spirochaetales bacterium]
MDKSDFPWLGPEEWVAFPDPSTADSDGLIGVGGNLSPGMLLSAYSQGIFPWFNEGEPILWWSLDPRFVLYPRNIRISRSMKKLIKKKEYTVTLDRDFPAVIRQCKEIRRRGQGGTWITDEMENAYLRLHREGYAHSVEVWRDDQLTGGLYGVSLGAVFFGESMFSLEPNCSKLGLIYLARTLAELDFDMIDCQQHTAHLGTMGAEDVPRKTFLFELNRALAKQKTWKGNWGRYTHLIKAAR